MPAFLEQSPHESEIPRCITERGLALTLRGALFINGRAELDPASKLLERLLAVLSGYPDSKVTIEGHTDALGSEGYNYALSQRRADSVKLYLIEQGIVASRVTALGKGESRPVAVNHTAAGRQMNSRIEVIVHTAPAIS